METRAAIRLFLLLVSIGTGNVLAADEGKYNVLFIISDDLRAELGCYGGMAKTPNLDALAKDGVLFARAYCQFPLCNPSRTSMLTGRYPLTTGVLGNRTWFGHEHPEFVSMPKYFREHGYVTLRAGKIFHGGLDDADSWTVGGEERVFDVRNALGRSEPADLPQDEAELDRSRRLSKVQQNDRWIVLEGDGQRHGDSRTADRAIKYLREYRDRPFFLACGFAKPHSPLAAPQRFYDLYDVNNIPLPPDFAPRPTVPAGFPPASVRAKNADLFVDRDATPQQAQDMIRAYLASTSYMDWNAGRVLAELDRLGLRERTIVVFWGDHGYQLGEKGKWSKAGSLFEQGTRVPLIIDAPQAAGNGKSCGSVVESIDIYPTLVDLCGLPQPAGLEGRSLVQLLNDPYKRCDSHCAFTIWSEAGKTANAISVRQLGWRYTEYAGPDGGALLFYLRQDPHELHNLSADPRFSRIRDNFSKMIGEFRARHESSKPADETGHGPS